jgi:hypothetical protein
MGADTIRTNDANIHGDDTTRESLEDGLDKVTKII